MAGDEKLLEQFEADNAYFQNAIDLIPTWFYFSKETLGKLSGKSSQDESETESDSGATKKRKSQNGISDKSKLKRSRFDPSQNRTVTQLQEELIEREKEEELSANKKHKKKHVNISHEPKKMAEEPGDLKELLKIKIEELQVKRKALTSKEAVERMKLKRQLSKLKRKAKLQKDKSSHTKVAPSVSNGTGSAKSPSSNKPIFNKDGKMVFSKFDFSQQREKQKSDLPTGKNYKKLLDKAQKQKEKMKNLKEKDPEAAQTLQEKRKWKTAMLKAQGVKLKDNTELLKKALRKKEKRKEKSTKEWTGRNEKVQEKKKQKQDKRQQNIQKRKKDKIDKKIKRAKKRGRIIPGF